MKYLQNSLLIKLILAFVFVTLMTTAVVAVFIRLTSADRLSQLVVDQQRSSLRASLESYYAQAGSWDQIVQDWPSIRFRNFAADSSIPNLTITRPPRMNFNGPDRRREFGLADQNGVVLVSVDPQYPEGSVLPSSVIQSGTAVVVNSKQVGTILTANLLPVFNPEENLFLQRTNEALLLGVVGALVFSLIIGALLARTLIHPLQALTQAAQAIARGRLEQQVKVTSKDEVGRLAEAFNEMSQEVVRSNQMRRQLTADIAHDLRTPLTVIAGYVESMRDGVLQPTPERLALIYKEIDRLQILVGDLKLLSLADSGELPMQPQPISPAVLLENAAAPFQVKAAQQQVALLTETAPGAPDINVDVGRMMQVFGNLISNALRYTPAGGKIALSARPVNGGVTLAVADTGSGIPAEDLPYIFERFHRVDPSRHVEEGEAGLGLAIVKALVEAHGGSVRAESKQGQGTAIYIDLPQH